MNASIGSNSFCDRGKTDILDKSCFYVVQNICKIVVSLSHILIPVFS